LETSLDEIVSLPAFDDIMPRYSRAEGKANRPCGNRQPLQRFKNATRVSPKTNAMIRKLPSGKYRLYSRKVNPKTGRRRNLGTFASRAAAEKHERAVQYFKRH
jgi:hypothetical protein